MRIFIIILILMSLSAAEVKYNEYTGEYEKVRKNDVIKYNPYTGEYEYTPKKSEIAYDPYNDEYYYEEE